MARVILTPQAVEDTLDLYNYILEQDGEEQAEIILERLEKKIYSLDKLFLRGKFPEELVILGEQKTREIQESPWRIFYRAEQDEVFVLAVLDGRRNMQDLLLERLTR